MCSPGGIGGEEPGHVTPRGQAACVLEGGAPGRSARSRLAKKKMPARTLVRGWGGGWGSHTGPPERSRQGERLRVPSGDRGRGGGRGWAGAGGSTPRAVPAGALVSASDLSPESGPPG